MENKYLQKLADKSLTKEELLEKVKQDHSLVPIILEGVSSSKAAIRYGASDGYVACEENINKADGKIDIILSGALSQVTAHILLPQNASAASVTVNGAEAGFNNSKIEKSTYVDFTFENHNVSTIEIDYKIEKVE